MTQVRYVSSHFYVAVLVIVLYLRYLYIRVIQHIRNSGIFLKKKKIQESGSRLSMPAQLESFKSGDNESAELNGPVQKTIVTGGAPYRSTEGGVEDLPRCN
jgi:hypothetical protein